MTGFSRGDRIVWEGRPCRVVHVSPTGVPLTVVEESVWQLHEAVVVLAGVLPHFVLAVALLAITAP